jgi:hypothetical protein
MGVDGEITSTTIQQLKGIHLGCPSFFETEWPREFEGCQGASIDHRTGYLLSKINAGAHQGAFR